MAPEVAAVDKKGGYNQQCDIWAVGITAIELAETQPPMFDLHPMRYGCSFASMLLMILGGNHQVGFIGGDARTSSNSLISILVLCECPEIQS